MRYLITDCPINWEPNAIRETIRKAQMEGHHPSRLLLGHCEAGALRRYLNDHYQGEDTVPLSLRDTYYLGLKVEEKDEEHLIALDGEKTAFLPQDDLAPSGSNQSPQWHEQEPIAAADQVESELTFESTWDTKAVRDLVAKKSAAGRTPAFLFVGHHEAKLLRINLNAAFGPPAVQSLKNLYYMGLEIIEVDTEHFLRTAGMKRVKAFRDALGRRPKWKDIQSASLWSYQAE